MTGPEKTSAGLSGSVSERLARLDVSVVSDALDRLGIIGQIPDVRPLRPGWCLAGPAFTVGYVESHGPDATVGDFLDDVPPGAVVLIDNKGRQDATVWGGIMSTLAKRRGVGGTVVHGVCRDLATAVDVDYPLFARAAWMRTGKDRVRLTGVNLPVTIEGVEVRPGDVIVGDADGVVAVPAGRVEEVADIGEEILAAETRIVTAVLDGQRLDEARAAHRYHQLQRLGETPRRD
jgi:4-hydroxy-4-methyl-2-oxoglutarate aldolase